VYTTSTRVDSKEVQNETHIPTVQNTPRPHPWVLGSHENPWWPRSDQRTPRQGSQALGCLSDKRRPAQQIWQALLHRLHKRQEFDAAFQGRVLAKTAHFVLHAAVPDDQVPPALGCVIPKRWAKRAVTRNMIRRQIFIVADISTPRSWHTSHCVVRLRARFDPAIWVSAQSSALRQAVREQLQELFARAEKSATRAPA
jgi:ribonuclease P protein component